MRAVCNVENLHVGYRFEFELSELIPRFFKLKDMRVGANQITDRKYISASVTPAQSCLSSFGLFLGQTFKAFTYPFKDFGLLFNAFTYPFKDFGQPFNVFTYPFKYLSQPFNALSHPFMDFGQPFKFFAIHLNGLCKRLLSVYNCFSCPFNGKALVSVFTFTDTYNSQPIRFVGLQ